MVRPFFGAFMESAGLHFDGTDEWLNAAVDADAFEGFAVAGQAMIRHGGGARRFEWERLVIGGRAFEAEVLFRDGRLVRAVLRPRWDEPPSETGMSNRRWTVALAGELGRWAQAHLGSQLEPHAGKAASATLPWGEVRRPWNHGNPHLLILFGGQ